MVACVLICAAMQYQHNRVDGTLIIDSRREYDVVVIS